MARILPPHEALRLWGLRLAGSMKSACRLPGHGGPAGIDFDAGVMHAVERFFDDPCRRAQFRDLALHVYYEGQPVGSFRYQRPGETKLVSYARLRWLPEALHQADPAAWALQKLEEEFALWWQSHGVPACQFVPQQEIDAPLVVEPLTTKEAAERLNLSPGAVAMLLERGRLKGYRHRHRWLIPEASLIEFRESRKKS